MMEMAKTQAEADKANNAFAAGGHHIGDFLPPEELNKFLNKYKVRMGGNMGPFKQLLNHELS